MSLFRSALRGVVAGAIGTVAMDAVWYARYRKGGGEGAFLDWDITRDVPSWDDASAPGQVGRKILEAVTRRPVPVERAAALTNVMHWGYGATWTAAYGLLVRGRARRPAWHGPAFGAAVWSSDYVSLPLLGIYEPIWTYDVQTLYRDLSAHLVFGAAADLALRLLPGG
jgi:hypothetical protein